MSLHTSPLYTSFDAEGCTFLGTVPGMGHLFDLYHATGELLAVPADHEQRGPIAMNVEDCAVYKEGHPLHTAFLLAKAKKVI